MVLFIVLTALALWLKYAFSAESGMQFSAGVIVTLLCAGVAMGRGMPPGTSAFCTAT